VDYQLILNDYHCFIWLVNCGQVTTKALYYPRSYIKASRRDDTNHSTDGVFIYVLGGSDTEDVGVVERFMLCHNSGVAAIGIVHLPLLSFCRLFVISRIVLW
jgi:hypothetical protein